MPIPYQPDAPDAQAVSLELVDDGVVIDRWTGYDINSDFLTPTDSFHFEIGFDETGLPARQRNALRFGASCRLVVEGRNIATGVIDGFEVTTERRGGTHITVRGRDRLGQTLDAVADPTFQLKEGGTLLDLLKRLFAPFGWSTDAHFEVDNAANRNAVTGAIRGTPTTKEGRSKKGKVRTIRPLRDFVLHQTKPYNHESVFHFASRVAQRHGLWIWCSADGTTLIVGKPDFDQDAIFALRRSHDGRGNILSGSIHFDMTDQPSVIIADSFGGGAEFGKGRFKAYIVNPILGLDDEGEMIPEITALLAKHPGAVQNELPAASFPFRAQKVPFRPMFLHDDESKTPEQLSNFIKREMSLLYRKAVTAQYTVDGHGQTVGGSFVAWAPDTVVDVFDEIAGFAERMYVLGVAYSKSRQGGTTTRLDLVRLNSIIF